MAGSSTAQPFKRKTYREPSSEQHLQLAAPRMFYVSCCASVVLSCSLLAAVYTAPPLMCCWHGWQLYAVCVVESVALATLAALQQQHFCISLVADFTAQQVVAAGVSGLCTL
jgi:hypothetical protein